VDEGPWAALGAIAAIIAIPIAIIAIIVDHKGGPNHFSSSPRSTVTAGADYSGTPAPRTEDGPPVRHEGTLRVANSWNEAYDLDAIDPEWSEGQVNVWKADIQKRNGNAIWFTQFTSYVSLPSDSEERYTNCQTSGYGGKGSSLPYESLSPGDKFCIKTSEGRSSFVRVLRVDLSASVLDLYVKTWEAG
jgi:hypothetical protein